MGSYGRKYSREERARMIQAEGDGLADQFRERIVALEADAVYAGRAIEHYQSEVLRVEADLAAARAALEASRASAHAWKRAATARRARELYLSIADPTDPWELPRIERLREIIRKAEAA